jgi:alpha-galactosidase
LNPILHFRTAGVSVLIECPPDALPAILHWGPDLGVLDDHALACLAADLRPRPDTTVDVPVPTGLLPEARTGWTGMPGLSGHHQGQNWSPAFTRVTYQQTGQTLVATARDDHARLDLTITIELDRAGLLRARAGLRNQHDLPYTLDALTLAIPVSGNPSDLLDQAGRWAKERIPQRRALTVGTHLRDNRRGRTGPDAATVLLAATADVGFQSGEAWGLHVGFSGNHRHYAERTSTGRTVLGGGELLLPGEVILAPGQTYQSPWVYAAYGRGLDATARRFHEHLRARPAHPTSPRPVVLNTWEAVYFDHDLDRLLDLADRAARVGVERFVLDDGWFNGRRDDRAGLGDWTVDLTVWPHGLAPLVKRVRELDMQFGLWFEPEMINPDSDLARAHPDWILQTGDRLPPLARNQQVLDLTNPDAYVYIRERLLALIGEYDLDFIKWDHNRDLVDAGSPTTDGRASVHAQTHAVYRLLDEIRAEYPGLEIESCSGGGSRVDLGILEHTDRVWASDCIDPAERQQIMRWTGQLLPPELIGSHIGAPRSHTTGRTHNLQFRAATAFFGHYGIEWDLTTLTERELDDLATWIALHKQHRHLLHTGVMVRIDAPDCVQAHGIVAADASEAIYEIAMMDRPSTWPPGRIRLPGLDPRAVYSVRPLMPVTSHGTPPTWTTGDLAVPGSALAAAGIAVPPMFPGESVLVHLATKFEPDRATRQDGSER